MHIAIKAYICIFCYSEYQFLSYEINLLNKYSSVVSWWNHCYFSLCNIADNRCSYHFIAITTITSRIRFLSSSRHNACFCKMMKAIDPSIPFYSTSVPPHSVTDQHSVPNTHQRLLPQAEFTPTSIPHLTVHTPIIYFSPVLQAEKGDS